MSDAPALAASSPPLTNERLGYAYMGGASLLFAVMGLFVKAATATLPFFQISFFRAFGGLLLAVAVIGVWRLPLTTRDHGYLVLRGFFGWLALVTYFLAIAGLNLADAAVLNHTSPFFTTLLAALLLGERLTRRTLACLAIASAGVVLVIGPTGGLWNLYGLIALGSAFVAALAYVSVKRANATNPPWIIVLWFSGVASLLTAPFLLWHYRAPTPGEWGLLAGAAISGTAAQTLMTYGYRHARASTASVISLGTPLYAALLAIAFLGQVPTWGTLAGGALIIAAGVALALAPPASEQGSRPS